MSGDGQVSELVARWQEERRRGRSPSPEELCAAHPELLAEVGRQVRVLEEMEGMFGVGSASVPRTTHDVGRGDRPGADGPGDAGPPDRAGRPLPAGFDGYDVLCELGRGGMGVVYKARQTALGRLVALKMILAEAYAGEDERARFRAEAEAVARLQHPNVVQVHEVGEVEGRPFFSLEFCAGGSLAERLGGVPQPADEAARLAETLARAVQAAHDRGVVHRDLKPANVLLTGDGVPKVADFGLAKRLEGDAGRTGTGAVVGTPSYMAPEQAAGRTREVGPASDVYALGAILYELLTGRPPFRADTSWDTLVQVVHHEAVPPSRLQPKVPRDLETICLKCLRKEPAGRYPSAAALAEDLRRFRAGEPIVARPLGPVGRAVKWARRRKAVAALAAGVVLATALGVCGVVWKWAEAEHHRGQAEAKARDERIAREKADQLRGRLDDELKLTRENLYLSRVQLAHQAWLANKVSGCDALLTTCLPEPGQEDLRGWEWHYLKRLCHPGSRTLEGRLEAGAQCLARSPDGRWIAAGDGRAFLHVWDAASGRKVRTWDAHDVLVNRVAFNKDGSRLASAAGWRLMDPRKNGEFPPEEVKIWEPASGKLVSTFTHEGPVFDAAWSPDGRLLATTEVFKNKPSLVLLWDVEAGKVIRRLKVGEAACALDFHPDGTRLAAGCDDGSIRVWRVPGGEPDFRARQAGKIRSLAYSPTGRLLAAAGLDEAASIWDVPTGKELWTPPNARRFVAFAPDGKRLATGGPDDTLLVWDMDSRKEITSLRGAKPGGLGAGAGGGATIFSFDGTTLLAPGWDGYVREWDAAGHQQARVLGVSTPCLAFDPASRRIALGVRPTIVVDVSTGNTVTTIPSRGLQDRGLAFTSGGAVMSSEFAIPKKKGTPPSLTHLVRTSDALTGQAATSTWHHPFSDLRLSRDGRFATASRGGVRVFDMSKRSEIAHLPEAGGPVAWDCLPGSHVAAAPRKRGGILVFDGISGAVLQTVPGTEKAIQELALHRPKMLLASIVDHTRIRIWDLQASRLNAEIVSGGEWFRAMAFSADGRRLFANEGSDIRIWDTKRGRPVLTLRGHQQYVRDLAVSPNGHLLATAGTDSTVRIWDATPRASPHRDRGE